MYNARRDERALFLLQITLLLLADFPLRLWGNLVPDNYWIDSCEDASCVDLKLLVAAHSLLYFTVAHSRVTIPGILLPIKNSKFAFCCDWSRSS